MPELRERGIARLWVFGSRATGQEGPASDWDILVEFAPAQPPTFDRFMGIKNYLESALNASVDLLSRTACKPRFFEAIQDELVEIHGA